MYNLTHLYAAYLNYHLTHKRAIVKKNASLETILNLAIAFLVVIFCAQLLSTWRFEADAKDLLTSSAQLLAVPAALAAEPTIMAEATPYTTNLVMKADQEAAVSLIFVNSGQLTWPAGKVTLETGPFLKTQSSIQHKTWLSSFKVLVLSKTVKPGEKITINFKVAGPDAKLIGVMQENFQLVYNEQPIKGSLARVFVDANQAKPTIATAAASSQSAAVIPAKTATVAQTTVKNIQYITAYNKLGQVVRVVKGQYVPGVSLTKPSAAAIAAEKARLALLNKPVIVKTAVVAPATDTNQVFCIALSDAEKAVLPECQTSNNESQAGSGIVNYAKKLIQEPLLRVGLFSSDQAQKITSNRPFDIYAANNVLVSNVSANTVVSVSFSKNSKQYTVVVGDETYQSSNYIRLISQSGNDGVFQLPDYRNTNCNINLNDNKFRRALEYRYAAKTGNIWLINELPIDSYLKGLAETSNASPVEFQKVLITAARTYALYHYYRGVDFGLIGASTKHADENFHVDATYDQVYRGYSSEIRMPRLSQAVDATHGLIVTYNNELAITPYFSRSDGRTRSWDEVWGGGEKAWLQSVDVPEEDGKVLAGHGVGMSAQGALLMVVDEGKSWSSVLSYFYQGTVLQQAY